MQQHTGQHVFGGLTAVRSRHRQLSPGYACLRSTWPRVNERSWPRLKPKPIGSSGNIQSIRFVSAEEAATLPVRKESAREGTLRLIDTTATTIGLRRHSRREHRSIGLIALAPSSGSRAAAHRVLCGGRAPSAWSHADDWRRGPATSVLPDEVPGAIERLQAETRDWQRTVTALEHELARLPPGNSLLRRGHRVGRLVMVAVEADAA